MHAPRLHGPIRAIAPYLAALALIGLWQAAAMMIAIAVA
jgi:hypothetical protein